MTWTPGEFDTGEAHITVKVSRTWPYELTTDDFRPEYFTKDGAEFQANDEQEFVVTVRR